MVDRSIPFYNLILRCDTIRPAAVRLPEGISLRRYRPGDETHWAALEHEIGDFASQEEAERYFCETYLPYKEDLSERCLFAVTEDNRVAGSCIAWRDPRNGTFAASLHWVVVSPPFARQGIGRALCQAALNFYAERGEVPVYIHTQPWSWKAVLLYGSLGFRIQKTDAFARYKNQYFQAMATLQTVLTAEQLATVESIIDT